MNYVTSASDYDYANGMGSSRPNAGKLAEGQNVPPWGWVSLSPSDEWNLQAKSTTWVTFPVFFIFCNFILLLLLLLQNTFLYHWDCKNVLESTPTAHTIITVVGCVNRKTEEEYVTEQNKTREKSMRNNKGCCKNVRHKQPPAPSFTKAKCRAFDGDKNHFHLNAFPFFMLYCVLSQSNRWQTQSTKV